MIKTFENLTSDFIKQYAYEFAIDVFAGPIGKATPMLQIHVFFDNDEYGEEINLTVDWYKGHYCFQPYHTCVISNTQNYESYSAENKFLHSLVGNIKNWIASKDTQLGLFSLSNPFQECNRDEIPQIHDLRKELDTEYIFVVSIGINNALDRQKLYKKQVLFSEELLPFLEWGFYGIDDHYDDGVFFKVLIQNDIIKLKDYDDIFLKQVKKNYLNYMGDNEIRSVYSSSGDGIRCPNCHSYIRYSLKKYKCVSCGKTYTKQFLSEKYNTEISYEVFPKIFK